MMETVDATLALLSKQPIPARGYRKGYRTNSRERRSHS